MWVSVGVVWLHATVATVGGCMGGLVCGCLWVLCGSTQCNNGVLDNGVLGDDGVSGGAG